MTNAVRGIGRGESPKHSYMELINENAPKEDNRSGDEIAADVINKLGLRFEE